MLYTGQKVCHQSVMNIGKVINEDYCKERLIGHATGQAVNRKSF